MRAVEGAVMSMGFKDTSCWPTHSFYDKQPIAFMPFISAPKCRSSVSEATKLIFTQAILIFLNQLSKYFGHPMWEQL